MQKILILDFGSQYTHLIATRIRKLGVYTEIMPNDVDITTMTDVQGIILSGGPYSVYESDSPQAHPSVWTANIPILGICYGHQLIAHMLGGTVKPGQTKEYGIATLTSSQHPLFAGLAKQETIWMSHGDEVTVLPKGFSCLGSTHDCINAVMGNDEKKIYGLQFHPEVTHSEHGVQILANFVFDICHATKNRDTTTSIKQIIDEIRKKVGDKNVFMLVSGGVDSMVAFALLNKALGASRCYGLCIDNGLMRHEEVQAVSTSLAQLGYTNFHVHDASVLFLSRLAGVHDPETKRKIIGDTFLDVQQEVVASLELDPEQRLLGQGTIYPDIIESQGTKHASLIKTHHNRVPIIQKLIAQGKVIEPLMHLYKDEVRAVGLELGLPPELIWRHPFPGPGLGIRVLCTGPDVPKTIQKLPSDQLRHLSQSFNEKITSPFSVEKELEIGFFILPVRSVGAQGDARTYKHPALLIGNLDRETLAQYSSRLTNTISEINRCLRLVDKKGDIETMHVHPASYLTEQRLSLLRRADHLVTSILRSHNLLQAVWQFPVVLVPFGNTGETIILRPVSSTEAMTASFARLPIAVVKEIASQLLAFDRIDAVMYDITNKPPATIEWE